MIKLAEYKVTPETGLKNTLYLMNYLENLSKLKPAFVSWIHSTFGNECQACIPGAVWKYVVNNFTFESDDPYDEKLTAPYLLNTFRKGDCDDFSLFIKTVIDILGGFKTHYILLGEMPNAYTHIAVFVHRGKYGKSYRDPVIVDGANNDFNLVPKKYKYAKII